MTSKVDASIIECNFELIAVNRIDINQMLKELNSLKQEYRGKVFTCKKKNILSIVKKIRVDIANKRREVKEQIKDAVDLGVNHGFSPMDCYRMLHNEILRLEIMLHDAKIRHLTR